VPSASRLLTRSLATSALTICAFVPAAGSQTGRQSHPPCATCIVISMKPEQVGLLPGELHGLEVFVEVAADGDISNRLEEIARRGGAPGVLVRGFPSDALTQELSPASTILLDLRGSTLEFDALLFELQTRLTKLRAASRRPVRLVVEPAESVAVRLAEKSTAGYWDALVLAEQTVPGAGSWVRMGDLDDVKAALDVTRGGGTDHWVWRAPEEQATALRAIGDLSKAVVFLPQGLLGDAGSTARVSCDGRVAELFLNPQTLDRVAIVHACPEATPVIVEPVSRYERVQLASGDALVRFAEAASDRFSSDTRVSGRKRLTVEEIVARHQASAAKQATLMRTLISGGTLTVTFEAPGFPAPVTISSDTTIYKDGTRTDVEQREIRVNGIAFRSQRVPRLPIIEPERVSAPPLAITLGEKYRYRLVGEELVAGVRTYVVAFEQRKDR
jgi:hypothetical protein